MNAAQIKALLILATGGLLALILGFSVATQEYALLALFGYFIVGISVLLFAENIPLLAFGLISPFLLPLPFVWGFPLFPLILALCTFKLILHKAVSQDKHDRKRIPTFVWPFTLFFLSVLLRYIIDPALPNFAGFGENVTGFRPYFAYFTCFYFLIILGYVIQTRAHVVSMIRWMLAFSIIFAVFLTACVFTKNVSLLDYFVLLGVTVTTFDNGLLRFLVLPSFGLMMILLCLLPNLVRMSWLTRIVLLILGTAAVVLGGNRIGLAMALTIVICVPLAQRKFVQTAASIFMIGLFVVVASYIGTMVKGEVGLYRVLALVSEDLALHSGATDSVRWREVRWERAWDDIQNKPLIGYSYGGLASAFVFGERNDEATVELDLASGGVHNGYLACAHAFGIPTALLFIGTLLWQIIFNFRRAMWFKSFDPEMSQIHTFIFALLSAFSVSIFVGTDLNAPTIWFLLCFGIITARIYAIEQKELHTPYVAPPSRDAVFQPIVAS